MRIAFLCHTDPADRAGTSGMVYSAYHSILRQHQDVRVVQVPYERLPARRSRPSRLLHRLAANTIPGYGRQWYEKLLQNSRDANALVADALSQSGADVAVSAWSGELLFGGNLPLPLVYASDSTACLLAQSEYLNRSPKYLRQGIVTIESDFAQRVQRAAFTSSATLKSAVGDHAYPEGICHMIPMGANLLPEPGHSVNWDDVPTEKNVRLLIIAADAHRKRLRLCTRIVAQLRKRGIRATLDHVGATPWWFRNNDSQYSHGILRMSDPVHRMKMQSLLSESHVLLLPSRSEMFGIAPAEAAHFGRPSIVSDAGGLPTVVEHGRGGWVVPVENGEDEYVSHIEQWISAPESYRRMSRLAYERARDTLTWDAWAKAIVQLCRDAVNDREDADSRGKV